METCHFGLWSHKQSKIIRKESLIKVLWFVQRKNIFNNTDVLISNRREEKIWDIFPHRYDLHKKIKKTSLL